MDIFLLVPPSVYLSVSVGSAVAFLFHVLVGHRHRSGLFYWPFGLAGFMAGGMVAERIGMEYLQVGDVSLLPGTGGALLGLVLAHLLLT